MDEKMMKAHLFASGGLINEALRAQTILSDHYHISADVWSVTSYKELRRDALETQRWNRLHPLESPRLSYIESVLKKEKGPFIAVTDSMKLVAEQIYPWVPGGLTALGTDGFGRSDSRSALRRFFEVDAESITLATLEAFCKRNKIDKNLVHQAIKDLGIDPEKKSAVMS
jgi:pyruvate dehydrogenase E1 component